MPDFQEIEDVRELQILSDELNTRVRQFAPHRRTKTVGYPSGHDDFPIQFAAKTGPSVRWWSSKKAPSGEAIINLIGRGDPESPAFLLIDLQFNVPIRKFGRSHGGAFVRHVATGEVFLAHRGIVTRGMARVRKSALRRHTRATMTPVATSAGSIDLFLVSALSSPTLLEDIADFAHEIRDAADRAVGEGEATDDSSSDQKDASELDRRVGEFFEEFVGKRRLPPRAEVIVTVRHGYVVSSLKQRLAGLGTVHNSKEVDLAIATSDSFFVFEVKTGMDTTSLYTAIGQVCLHSLALAKQFRGRQGRRVLVLPGRPSDSIRKALQRELSIEILTYDWGAKRTPIFDKNDLVRLVAPAK